MKGPVLYRWIRNTKVWIEKISVPILKFRFLVPIALIAISALIATILIINRPVLQITVDTNIKLPIDAYKVNPESITVTLYSQGEVAPHRQTPLSAQVEGNVIEVSSNFLVGQFFKSNDILLKIDNRDYLVAVKEERAEVASAASRLALESSLAQQAKRDWQELQIEENIGDANDLTLHKPQLKEAQARLQSAQARLQQAELDLARTVIYAPYNGLVRSRTAEVGQYINKGASLGVIYATDYAEVRLPLPEQQLDYIDLPSATNENQPLVSMSTIVGESQRYWYGRIMRTENIVNERHRSLMAIAVVADPYGVVFAKDNKKYVPLRFGSFVKAQISGRTIDNLVPLPRNLIRTQNSIWVVEDFKLKNRFVELLLIDSKEVYVRSGLAAGDIVNLSAVGNVVPGTEVEISNMQLNLTEDSYDFKSKSHQNELPAEHISSLININYEKIVDPKMEKLPL